MAVDSYKIISNGFVITCDHINRGGRYDILVRNDRIAAVSNRATLLPALYPGATVIDATNKLIIPGFVNAHFHSESILLRAQTDNLHYELWNAHPGIQECIRNLLDPGNKQHLRSVYLMSYFQHLKSGTTCVGEYGLPFPESGFTHVLHSMERTEVKSAVALQNWDQIQKAGQLGGGTHRFFVNVGKEAEFTVYSFEGMVRAAKELRVPLLAHVAEQRANSDIVRKTFQKNILGVLQDFGVVRPETVFIHLNHMGGPEAEALAEAGASVVVCARSAAFKRTGYPFLRCLARERIPLAVGTDWGSVDVLGELQFLFRLHLLVPDIPPLSPLQLVRMGTINGARTLGFSHETGSIEVGKRADLTFYRLDDLRVPAIPGNAEAETLSSLLLNHLTSRDVSDVMINGEFYIARGEVMTMAEEEVLEGYRLACSNLLPAMRENLSPTLLSPAAAPSGAVPRILPFAANHRNSHREEGFERGFSADDTRASTRNADKATKEDTLTATDSGESIGAGKEPSKEIWRTFGEEDF